VSGCSASGSVKKRKEKTPAGSDDTVSIIKGRGYLSARTRQPPTEQLKEINVGQGGCVP
jgi:hypothetical protein